MHIGYSGWVIRGPHSHHHLVPLVVLVQTHHITHLGKPYSVAGVVAPRRR
jgi:hypothetical protein